MPPLDLESNQQTVSHMAPFFEELKSEAGKLAASAGASQRGYFSPGEEEATGKLLVSYWHARNALFDLITSLRRTPADAEDQERAFLVGFAAATLLVDAARFLRDTVDARPVVKRKLNEPAPEFGIPAGVYDTIQKSLLSTRNGWHLYHAVKYFTQHEAAMTERAGQDDRLRKLLDVIRQRRQLMDVPLRQFARASVRTRGRRMGSHLQQNLFGRALYGLQKLMGTLVADKYLRLGHQPALPPAVRIAVQGLLLPGDVLAVRKEYALTTYFLPGYWPHVALYLGPASSLRNFDVGQHGAASSVQAGLDGEAADGGLVMESMRDGVQLRALSSPFGSDSLIVLRPKLEAGDVNEAIARSFRHHRKPYDFSFDFTRADRLVCTEVVYRSFDGIGSMHLPLVQRVGRPTLSADDLIGMAVCGRAFEPVAVYAPAFSDRIITGAETLGLIRRARQTEPTP